MSHPFPFSAIVAQTDVKNSLLMTAIDPTIGGVLIFGDRGTGKSTAIRGLASLLPPMEVVDGCLFNLDANDTDWKCPCCESVRASGKLKIKKQPVPVVDLPLGVTEDRVVGTFDIEHALSSGEKRFEPGLLAEAHRGFLYVDEVNLLEDHIVDVLLDVAASAVNVVERDGISIRHPARFVIIGSGNPEEGELRPQLLDRFGLSVEVKTPDQLSDRIEIVSRRDEYDQDPASFVKKWKRQDTSIRKQISKARSLLPAVELPTDIRELVANLCLDLNTDGLRGDLTLIRAARAMAALDNVKKVKRDHVFAVAASALRHRLRRDPLDESGSTARIERAIDKWSERNAAA